MPELYEWQQQVVELAADRADTRPVIVEAPSNAGKTTALSAVEDAVERVAVRDGFDLEAGEQTLASAYEGDVDVVLVDEAGRLTDPWRVVDVVLDHPDVQTVFATVPACPPMRVFMAEVASVESITPV